MSHKPYPMGLGGCEATPGSTGHTAGMRKATPGAKRRGKGLCRELGRSGLPAAGRAQLETVRVLRAVHVRAPPVC